MVLPAPRPASIDYIRRKLDGKTLKPDEIRTIIQDITQGNLTDVELTAYATATYVHEMNVDEIVAIGVEYSTAWPTDSIVSVKSEEWLYLFPLSPDAGGDRKFIQALEELTGLESTPLEELDLTRR